MRQIKFRGKPIEDYGDIKWFYGNVILSYEDKLAYIEADGQGTVPVEWESVCQFTGQKDQNGNEIYERDIVKGFLRQQDCNFLSIVTFEDAMFKLQFDKDYGADVYEDMTLYNAILLEVAGNIYENPKLLKSE